MTVIRFDQGRTVGASNGSIRFGGGRTLGTGGALLFAFTFNGQAFTFGGQPFTYGAT
jgi:hypothetical protein